MNLIGMILVVQVAIVIGLLIFLMLAFSMSKIEEAAWKPVVLLGTRGPSSHTARRCG